MISVLSDLLPLVVTRTRNCPANYSLLALRHGWRAWCEEGLAFRDTITVPAVSNSKVYRLLPKWDAEIRSVVERGVRYRTDDDIAQQQPGRYLSANEYDVMLYSDPLGDQRNKVQPDKTTTDVTDSGFSSILLGNALPAAAVALCVDVILVPMLNPDDDSLPLSLANYAGGGIVAGALAWLARQAGKPWSNARLYRSENDKFQESVTRAFMDSVRSGRNEPVLQRPPENF